MNMHEGVSAVPPLSSVQGWYYQSQIHEAKGQIHEAKGQKDVFDYMKHMRSDN